MVNFSGRLVDRAGRFLWEGEILSARAWVDRTTTFQPPTTHFPQSSPSSNTKDSILSMLLLSQVSRPISHNTVVWFQQCDRIKNLTRVEILQEATPLGNRDVPASARGSTIRLATGSLTPHWTSPMRSSWDKAARCLVVTKTSSPWTSLVLQSSTISTSRTFWPARACSALMRSCSPRALQRWNWWRSMLRTMSCSSSSLRSLWSIWETLARLRGQRGRSGRIAGRWTTIDWS